MAVVSEFNLDQLELLKIVAIQFNGRSGSYLLSNLLDNANEVISCPPDSIVNPSGMNSFIIVSNYCMDSIKEGDELDAIAQMTAQRITNKFPNLLQRSDEINGIIGVESAQFQVVFRDFFFHYLSLMRTKGSISTFKLASAIFKITHLAYAVTKGRDIRAVKCIAWQMHNPFSPELGVKEHLALFGAGLFLKITCIRNPVLTIDSHLHHKLSKARDEFSTHHLAYHVFGNYAKSLDEQPVTGMNSLAVKFEDMHMKTEQLMMKLSSILGIQFDPNMLNTTLDGKTYYFKGANGLVTGTNQFIDKKKSTKVFSNSDISRISHLLRNIETHYGYSAEGISSANNVKSIFAEMTDQESSELVRFLRYANDIENYPSLVVV